MVIQGNMRQTRKIRKGKDIVVRWSLYRNENGERECRSPLMRPQC